MDLGGEYWARPAWFDCGAYDFVLRPQYRWRELETLQVSICFERGCALEDTTPSMEALDNPSIPMSTARLRTAYDK